MTLAPEIEAAVRVAFGPADHDAVRQALADLPWADADWLRAAVLALTFGDRPRFDQWVGVAAADTRDVAYVLESPELVADGLTRAEVVRRYRAMGLPVPQQLANG